MPRFIDVVEAPNQAANELVIRVPEYGSGDFRLGSQVIVRESQRAIFYRDGKSLDMFEPGRHTITTANLPLISNLMSFFTGGNNVFTAEAYFVNIREFTDLKWGTPQPISLRDNDLGIVRLRAFGQYTMQVADPKLFVDKIVGTQGAYTTAQIEEYLRGAIITRLTDVIGENMTSILDLPKLFDEISAGMKAKVQDDFAAVGISLRQFMLVSVSPTDETAKALDERAAMGAIGNLNDYMKFKAAQAMGDAAKQPGGGTGDGLGLGAGIGLGSAMAGAISQAMAGGQQTAQPAAAAPSAAAAPASGVMTLDEAAAYLKVPAADVQSMIDSGELKAKKIGSQYRISKDAIDTFLSS